ncbi:metal ABC transporter ATP-binding protein [Elusimicrobiota bacterium]
MNEIINIKNVGVSYHENVLLKDISFSANEKDFITILGPNGSGKTTILTLINGLRKITSGSVKIFGQELTETNISEARKNIGYIPQHSNIDPKSLISVREAVSIGRFGKIGLFKDLADNDNKIIDKAIETVGMTKLSNRPIGSLSGGEHQKVSIARVMAQQPKIMLFDEPTSSLDLKAQKDIVMLIERIYKQKKYTIVFVTHILNHIPSSCNKVILVKDGKINLSGSFKEAVNEKNISKLYDCRVKTVGVRKRNFIWSDFGE